jgi:hypothetical protein
VVLLAQADLLRVRAVLLAQADLLRARAVLPVLVDLLPRVWAVLPVLVDLLRARVVLLVLADLLPRVWAALPVLADLLRVRAVLLVQADLLRVRAVLLVLVVLPRAADSPRTLPFPAWWSRRRAQLVAQPPLAVPRARYTLVFLDPSITTILRSCTSRIPSHGLSPTRLWIGITPTASTRLRSLTKILLNSIPICETHCRISLPAGAAACICEKTATNTSYMRSASLYICNILTYIIQRCI